MDAGVSSVELVDEGVYGLAGVLGEEAEGAPAAHEAGEVRLDDVDLKLDVRARVSLARLGGDAGRGVAERVDLCVGEEAGFAGVGVEVGPGLPRGLELGDEELGIAAVLVGLGTAVEEGGRVA